MPVNPLDYFEVGQRVGKAKRSTFGRVAEGVMGDFQAERDRKLKQSTELDTYKKKKDIDVAATKSLYPSLTGGQSEDMMLAGVGAKGTPFYRSKSYMKQQAGMRAEAEFQKRGTVGLPADVAGRVASANEAVRAFKDMRRLLFPDGTPESFKRQSAYKMRPFPFRKPIPNSYEAQTLARRAGQAAAGKLLVQSGVQTRESEYERLGEQMIANVFSNPQSAFDSLDEGERFYSEFLQAVDPQGQFHQGSTGGNDVSSARQEALDAIQRGAPESAVRQRFLQEFGEEL